MEKKFERGCIVVNKGAEEFKSRVVVLVTGDRSKRDDHFSGVCISAYDPKITPIGDFSDTWHLSKFEKLYDSFEEWLKATYAAKLHEAEEKHKQLIKTLLEIEEGKRKELEDKIKELERWKAEAICLLSKIDNYADKHPEIKVGMSKVDFTIDRALSFDKAQKQATGWRPLLEDVLREDTLHGRISMKTINKITKFLYGE